MNNSKEKIKARKPFRIIAGIIALVCLYSLFGNMQMIREGYWNNIAGLLIALVFMIEFASIAFRGDGLFFYKSERFNRNR